MEHIWLVLGCLLALSAAAFTIWRISRSWARFATHPLLSEPKVRRLDPASATRQRLAKAAELWELGWATLEGASDAETAKAALVMFGKALEVDEMGCGWKKRFERKLVLVGELFALPGGHADDRFHACLAEAYFVLLLNAVVEVYGKPVEEEALASDYRLVKSRLDECVALQPSSPVAYKLRGDWCRRFASAGLADRAAMQTDFETAIRLAEEDVEGRHLGLHGLSPAVQRSYLLAYCHFQLACLLQQGRELGEAAAHFEAALEYADPDFVQLADTHFNLSVIAVLNAGAGPEEQAAALRSAAVHYKQGEAAMQRRQRWCSVGDDVARELAGALLARVSSGLKQTTRPGTKPATQKKDD